MTGAVPATPAFFRIAIHDLAASPPLTGPCADYEAGEWRAQQMATYLLDALPEFCLNASELARFTPQNALTLIRQCATRVYETRRFQRRGEFGELLLHVLLRETFKTVPAISKIYYKDSPNDTVKGFDAVHVVERDDALQLWLGEVKFYSKIGQAISAVISELRLHTKRDYLRKEFVAIVNKLDQASPHFEKLRTLLHPNTSLDSIFAATCFPVLLTYDSDATSKYSLCDEKYRAAIERELWEHHAAFKEAATSLPGPVSLHLFLVPLSTKKVLIKALDGALRKWQAL